MFPDEMQMFISMSKAPEVALQDFLFFNLDSFKFL